VSRWLKVALAVVAGLIVLLVINAVVVSNETKSAELRTDGAQLVETANGTLQLLDEGDPKGSPIVLVHCYTCSMRWWDKLAPLLAQGGHRVIRVDLLGHGGSDKPGGGYAITDQANALAEALAKLGVSGATVVGHSLGGTVVTALAEQSPQLASRVVIIDQAPDDSFEHLSLSQRAGTWPVVGQALDRLMHVAPTSVVRDQYGQAFAPGFSISAGFENPDQVVDDLRAMTYTSYDEAPDAESDYSSEQPLDERLQALGVPLLVIFGAEDQIYDAERVLPRYQAIPGAEVKLIQGAGHSPNVEKADEVAPLVLAFAKPPPAPKERAQPAQPQAKPPPASDRAEKRPPNTSRGASAAPK
jgi:pimeloyl-ACP methyl ester carboxylesterase